MNPIEMVEADSPPGPVDTAPAEWYRARLDEARARGEALDAELNRYSTWRVWAFLAGAIPLLLLETSPRSWWPALIGLGGLAAATFVFLMRRHRRIRARLRRNAERIRIHEEGLARLVRDFDALPRPELGKAPEGHPWAGDLDTLGPGSLGHLLGTVRSAPGRAALRQALLYPRRPRSNDPADWIRQLDRDPRGPDGSAAGSEPDPEWAQRRDRRQEAVAELAGHPGFLQSVQLAARLQERPEDPGTLVPFLHWARGEGWTRDRRWALPLARVLAVANPGLIVAWLAGWVAAPIWLFGVVAALALHRRTGGEAASRFDAAEGGDDALRSWADLLEIAARTPGESAELAELRDRLGSGTPEAADALRRLRRITDWAAVRRSGLTHFPLVALFAWDLHHLDRLERWRERWGDQIDGWVHTLGELELLTALAVLRFEHPSWSFAVPAEPGTDGIRAEALRHPLLPPDKAVPNDVELPAPGGLLLVTGSNMSGKSTLLRAVGANQLLFLIGGPVAATRLRTPPIEPFTSMRIQDSLSQGVSFFLAELHRLRDVVEAARARPTLVLLDEILQGTNTAERRIAARIILSHLIRAGAVGAVSTHDLTLGREPAIASDLTEVHLREDVIERDGTRTLTFDHRLREGPATSKNALLLLDMVGLGE